jgi:Flp pilus assembly protein TadB
VISGSRTQAIWIVCALTGGMLAFVIGGPAGIAVGIAVAVAGPRLLASLESRAQRARREDLERQVPAVADLLAACLAAGATQRDSARAVGRALGEPVATPLARLTGALDLGADPVTAWASLGSDTPLRPIARAAARSAETGAPLSLLLAGIADDQRDVARARAEAAARAAGVKSVAPLVACFLPAFILIGIVPVVASLALPLLQ